jgi:hypothetical protein
MRFLPGGGAEGGFGHPGQQEEELLDMKITRHIPALLAVAGMAYAAGHIGALSGNGSGAWAQEEQEIPPEMAAYLEAGTPGKHHRVLDVMVGEWEAEFKFRMAPDEEPAVSKGTVRRKWVLDGRFIEETVEAETDMGSFRGLGYLGYNNIDGQYEVVWMDTMMTAMYRETGTYHPDDKILHVHGSYRDPVAGRVVSTWGRLDLSGPDRHTYVGYANDADGVTYKAIEGVIERKAGPSKSMSR